MESKAKAMGHPIHPMLIVYPLGLLSTAVACDAIAEATGDETFAVSSKKMLGAGLIGGAAAAVTGLIDFLAIPRGTRARRIGLIHGLGNAVAVGLFAASYFMRTDKGRAAPTARALAGAGAAISVVTGWLGGELVDRLGVGVDPGAHLDAPNSLARKPAHLVAADPLMQASPSI